MRRLSWIPLSVALLVAAAAGADAQTLLFEENFDGLTLGPSVNERAGFPTVTRETTDTDSAPIPGVWSATGPAGWTVDNTLGTFGGAPTVGNSGVPTGGVVEWEGWTFADKDFWASVDDQQRSSFTNATGTVAVADPDEYYDLGIGPDNAGFYNTSLSTPSVAMAPLGSVSAGVQLSFDTSYRLEAADDDHPDPAFNNLNNQSGEVIAVFDTGETQTASIFDSLTSPADVVNGSETLAFFPSTLATSVQFFFNLGNAGNDWWWAIDNVAVADLDINSGLPLPASFTEDFEGVALGDSVNERVSLVPDRVTAENNDPATTPVENAFTHTPPAGWTRTNNGPATISPNSIDDNNGVFEWEGWSFTTPDFWTFADGQQRELFTNGTGVIAVADGDEWDDLGPAASDGLLDTLLETPELDVTGTGFDELQIAFDASWRDEDDNTAVVTATFDDGTVIEVLRWESDTTSAFFFDDAPNTEVYRTIAIPDGATTVKLSVQYIGGNDWWFAVDNLRVSAVPEPASAALVLAVAGVATAARRRR